MIRHASTEELSAYLDSELAFAKVRQLEAHCAACLDCGARLASLKRVVHGLSRAERVGRAVPPPALRQQIRRQVQATPPAQGFRSALESFRFMLFPLSPALRSFAVLGLAMAAGLFAVNHGLGTEPQPRPEVVTVETFLGGAPLALPPTTSEVAGRKFIWTDAGWVQRGLEGEVPVTLVDSGSPRGREMLTRYSDLEFLLADGSSVVLRYKLETVEIRNSPSTRVLGYDSKTRPGPMRLRSMSA
jgi:hypothetical protein